MTYDPLTLYLAKIIGTFFIIVAIAFLTQRPNFEKTAEEIGSSHALMTIISILPLALGLTMTYGYNLWVADWPVIITVIGWLILIIGIFRLFFHNLCMKLLANIYWDRKKFLTAGVLMLLVGSFLLYKGFYTQTI